MSRSTVNPWLSRFAAFTACSTLFLILVGGLVTSHGVGMAVPDWPTTYGYNMFLFPPSQWVGGIFYEHSHRLVASFVGLLTTVLAVWLWLGDKRPFVRWLGVAAFVGVGIQGLLGGLRVTLYKDEIGIFHAVLAQLFFALVSAIALFTSRWWTSYQNCPRVPVSCLARRAVVLATCLIFVQLALGAAMRHEHAGLAVPDFPLAYGKFWPPLDAASIDAYNRTRLEERFFNPITAPQIVLHMSHRFVALLIVGVVLAAAWALRRHPRLAKFSSAWLGLMCAQALLGAATVWSNKAADVATAHVMVGAMSLVSGVFLWILTSERGWRVSPDSAAEALLTKLAGAEAAAGSKSVVLGSSLK